jgi:hypothetical protein
MKTNKIKKEIEDEINMNIIFKEGIELGKKQATADFINDEIKFLTSLPTQSGKASIYQRNRVKQRIKNYGIRI